MLNNVNSNQLYIAKLYSVMDIKKFNFDVIESIKLAKVKSCYVLVVKQGSKFIVIPNSQIPNQIEVIDFKKATELHQIVIQSDDFKKCKPLTYYAPFAANKVESAKNLRVYSEFIAENFIEGRNHEVRRKLNNVVKYCHRDDVKNNINNENVNNNTYENIL